MLRWGVDEHPLGAEISDMVVAYDPASLSRRPVTKREVQDYYRGRRNRQALRVVRALPALADGTLDPEAVDAMLLRAHAEIQRLSEEFLQARRLHDLLAPLVATMRREGVPAPYRIVDVGCGTGFALRWLAMHGGLGDDVELVGADYNVALIERARRLAAAEGLACSFQVANAFQLDRPGHIFYSIGVIHHFRGDDLLDFCRQQMKPTSHAFIHFDIKASWLAPLGAWLFHIARMNEPLARHDGVLSARRAHDSAVLLDAARRGSDAWLVGLWDEDRSLIPILRVMHAVVAMRPALLNPLRRSLGDQAHRLEAPL
jgi:2-polyprenyl-3-methyl-5-hydroxy-6-metoxy-1,4-benzoquinol methylase